jgi:alginate production protein
MRRARFVWLLLLCAGCLAGSAAATPAAAVEDESSFSESEEDAGGAKPEEDDEDDEEDEAEALRERLTEREDKRRPLEPWSVSVGGRPLTVSGEYEIELLALRSDLFEEDADDEDRLFLEHGIEAEAFYTFGEPLSIFAQIRVAMEEDLVSHAGEEISDVYVERGEMWLASEDIGGTGVSVDVGHLDFEDDRRWWWDAELDAARVTVEVGDFELAVALGRELFAERTDEHGIDPEQEDVMRVIGEASWDWRFGHSLQGFLLYQDDRSPSERPGQVVSRDREDDADARLTWLGARAIGALDVGAAGLLGYWLDVAWVRGDERRNEFEDLSRRRSAVEERNDLDVSGWAFDAGVTWLLPGRLEPRIFAGYARGSGDRSRDRGTDRSFRQTGLEENEAGFGGVERFSHYGVLLDPELSNLGIVTAGAGISLLRSSSLDLAYHRYRLVEPAEELLDARVDVALDGRHRDVGHEVDLVLALEEWERLEFELILSAFRAGDAFGRDRGSWSLGGFFATRIAF